MSESQEFSESGQPIHRHKERARDFEFTMGSEQNIEIISGHIEKYLGTPATVFHELVSDLVHIDVHIVPPTKERPIYALVTSGMSDKPMKVPEGAEEFRYAELLLYLPPNWPMTQEDWKRDKNSFWPIQALKSMARFPHEYDTWLHMWHTVPNGNPPSAFGNTDLSCVLIGPAVHVPQEFVRLKVNDEKTINFFGVYFIYQEEMELKLKKGAQHLWDPLVKSGFTGILDTKRKNIGKKLFGLF